MRTTCGLAAELVVGIGVVLEMFAVLMRTLRALALGLAFRKRRLREFANAFCALGKVDQLAIRVLPEEMPIARRTVGDA